jgi:hypothetical protein
LAGIPTTAGTFTGTVTASSANGTATQNFSITIAAGTTAPPIFTSGPPPNSGTVGSFYDSTCAASGFPFPTFTVTAGSLPPGLNLTSVGRLSGTPIAPGNFAGVITATNSAGSDNLNYSISIQDVTAPPPPPVPGGIVNVAGILYDGDHGGFWPVGPVRRENAFSEIPGYYIYRQKWRAKRLNWGATLLDSPCPNDPSAFLVDETPTEDAGGADLLQWDRIWANVPGTITDGEMVDYVWQIIGTIDSAPAIQSIPLTRWATRKRTFHHTSNPGSIPKSRLPRAGVFAGQGLTFDGFQNLNVGTTTIARDDDVRRWMGNIWVKTHWDITI